jgi:hypothetical protein
MTADLFLAKKHGAKFSHDTKYRYQLWRTWDESRPKVLFIMLNPSTANAETDDNTISKIKQIADFNGFGGLMVGNLFAFITSNPDVLRLEIAKDMSTAVGGEETDLSIREMANQCNIVVFAWGAFNMDQGREELMIKRFPDAMCLKVNRLGSPKHPLYCKTKTNFIPYK